MSAIATASAGEVLHGLLPPRVARSPG